MSSPCEICEGKRFKAEVLEYHLRGKSISNVRDMTAEEALAFFTEKKIRPVLQAMNDVGLSYLKLGQPLSTLSGGEVLFEGPPHDLKQCERSITARFI